MAKEIERKFLIKDVEKLQLALCHRSSPDYANLTQGYLSDGNPVVRVRTSEFVYSTRHEQVSYMTVKGKGTLVREEIEFEIPNDKAAELFGLCKTKLSKTRYQLGDFEVDYFPELELWLAEIELSSTDQEFETPEWLGIEVTDDPAYANVNIARKFK